MEESERYLVLVVRGSDLDVWETLVTKRVSLGVFLALFLDHYCYLVHDSMKTGYLHCIAPVLPHRVSEVVDYEEYEHSRLDLKLGLKYLRLRVVHDG